MDDARFHVGKLAAYLSVKAAFIGMQARLTRNVLANGPGDSHLLSIGDMKRAHVPPRSTSTPPDALRGRRSTRCFGGSGTVEIIQPSRGRVCRSWLDQGLETIMAGEVVLSASTIYGL
jgi:hypothetical protein